MDGLIAGGHGNVARRLIRLLARDGHRARGLIRNPDHGAESLGLSRFVIVSSIGAHDPDAGPDAMRPYLRAKAAADGRVATSALDWKRALGS